MNMLQRLIARICMMDVIDVPTADLQLERAYADGKTQAAVHFKTVAMPFTDEQMSGREYGNFITPRGFACDAFGECSVPAPGPHGYEQRAYYVARSSIDANSDLRCHLPHKFERGMGSEDLVPVIVTVLR